MVNEALQLWEFVRNNDTYFHSSSYKQLTISARQKIRQCCITSIAFALPDWLELLPYEQYLTVTPKCPNQSWGHPASYSSGTRVLSQGVKRPGCEKTAHLHYSAKVKNVWSCISTLATCLYNMDGDNLTFTFLQVCYFGSLQMYTNTF